MAHTWTDGRKREALIDNEWTEYDACFSSSGSEEDAKKAYCSFKYIGMGTRVRIAGEIFTESDVEWYFFDKKLSN